VATPPSARSNQRLFRTVILIAKVTMLVTMLTIRVIEDPPFCLVRDRPGCPRAFHLKPNYASFETCRIPIRQKAQWGSAPSRHRLSKEKPYSCFACGLLPSKPSLGMIVRDGGGGAAPIRVIKSTALSNCDPDREGDDTRHDAYGKSHRRPSFLLSNGSPGQPPGFSI